HFSVYSSPYNHLIGEAAALYLIGCWIGSPRAAAWRQQAAQVLLEHGPRQFHSDGVCVEQAMGYQFFTLMFLTLAWCAAGPGGGDLRALESTLRNAWRAAAAFQQPDGLWPPFGDIDSARTVPVIPESLWDFRGLCGIGAVLFRDPPARTAGEIPGEELFWLLGTKGVEKFLRLPHAEVDGVVGRFDDSGYAVFRSPAVPGDWLLVDGGPISAGLYADATPSTAHGHADLLQVLVHVGGEPFLVDSGMSTYAGRRDLVDWFRDARAHNTLQIEDAPVARHAGRLGWSHVCHRYTLEAADESGFWLAHAAYQPSEGVFADRYILMIAGTGLWIADHIRTPDPRWIDWSFNLSERAARELRPDSGMDEPLPVYPWPLLVSASGSSLEWNVVRATPDRPVAWRGAEYGVRFAGTQLHGRANSPGELIVLFAFAPLGSVVRTSVRLAGTEVGLQPISAGQPITTAAARVPADGWSVRGGGLDCDLAWGSDGPPGDENWEQLAPTGWRIWKRRLYSVSESRRAEITHGDPHEHC
ncbi:MAG: hypothetical protein EHM42_01870, partial [Planctomycetaceae bacterium]